MEPDIELRTEVQWFAEIMERTLRDNDHKGGWKGCTDEYLISRLREEVDELIAAMAAKEPRDVIYKEAADVANFALMIADCASYG